MNREDFFAFTGRVIQKVHVKEMNTDFYVRSLTQKEKSAWEMDPMTVTEGKHGSKFSVAKDRMATAKQRLVEITTCYEDGTPFFQRGDAARIGEQSAGIVEQLYEAAARLSAITKEDLEDIAKNSKPDPDGASESA